MDFNEVRTVAVGGYNKADVEEYVKYHNDKYTNLLENGNSQIAFYSKNVEELEMALQILNMQNKDYQDEIAKLRFTIELEYKKILDQDKQKKLNSVSLDKEDLQSAKRRADFIISTAHDESDVILSEVKRKAAIVMRKLRSSEEQASSRADKIAKSIVDKAVLEAQRIIKQANDDANAIMLAGSPSDLSEQNKQSSQDKNQGDMSAEPYTLPKTDELLVKLEGSKQLSVLTEEKEEQLSLNFDSMVDDVSQSLDELEQVLREL